MLRRTARFSSAALTTVGSAGDAVASQELLWTHNVHRNSGRRTWTSNKGDSTEYKPTTGTILGDGSPTCHLRPGGCTIAPNINPPLIRTDPMAFFLWDPAYISVITLNMMFGWTPVYFLLLEAYLFFTGDQKWCDPVRNGEFGVDGSHNWGVRLEH